MTNNSRLFGKLCLTALLIFLPSMATAADSVPVELHESHHAGSTFMGIRLLGTVVLKQDRVDGVPIGDLSALAWDEDRGLLYAASNHGYLYHLKPGFQDSHLVSLRAIAGYPLRDAKGRPLKEKFADAEGMLLRKGRDGQPGTGELVISFERRPRILRYSTTGQYRGQWKIAEKWQNRRTYRSENKAIEAIALHPRWGLLAAPEWPLRGARNSRHYPIIRLANNRRWLYPRFPAPKSGLVAMEVLEDGGLLTLERAYVSMWQPMYIVLRRSEPLPKPRNKPLKTDIVAEFNSAKGWVLDNFEGLTRHRGQRFFMVSDDNSRALQRTLLVYFELL